MGERMCVGLMLLRELCRLGEPAVRLL